MGYLQIWVQLGYQCFAPLILFFTPMCVGPPCIISKMSKCRWHSLWVVFVFRNHAMNSHPHVQRINSSHKGWLGDSWTNPWIHGHLQRFCSPNDDVNKGQLLSESLAFCSWGACHRSRREFVQGECSGMWSCNQKTNEHLKAQVSCVLFGYVRPKKQYQLQASWKNLGKSWTCAICILCYLFLLQHCKPIERSMGFFSEKSAVPNEKMSWKNPHFFGDETTRKLMPWISIDLIWSDIWKDRMGMVIWRCHSLGSSQYGGFQK